MRLKNDWLYFIKDDVHWILLLFTHFSLFLYTIYQSWFMDGLQLDIILVASIAIRFCVNVYINHLIYGSRSINLFSNGQFSLDKSRYARWVLNLGLLVNALTIGSNVYIALSTRSLYRFTYTLLDVVLHVMMVANIFVELAFFKSQVKGWKKQYILQ